ncbi:hypothetical protein [Pseudomonas sp. CGJS7]|uniref:hypothetical protein n=1 Tax=Pseudomonas sp. CGJS7 TaxID=3109348 RepID=UPI00300A6B04
MAAVAKTAADLAAARVALDEQVRRFARNWLGRELDDAEHTQLTIFLAALDSDSRDQASNLPIGGGLRGQAGNTVDSERQRIQNLIRQTLGRTQTAIIGNANAERAAETAVLGAVERASSLQDLRPPKPAAATPEQRDDPLIAQIAGRLTELIKIEVEKCFQEQFGPLALQLQAVIEAARSSGLLPKGDADSPGESGADGGASASSSTSGSAASAGAATAATAASGTDASATSGAAPSGAAASGSTPSRSTPSGGATSGGATSGSATSGSATSGSATSGTAPSSSSTSTTAASAGSSSVGATSAAAPTTNETTSATAATDSASTAENTGKTASADVSADAPKSS